MVVAAGVVAEFLRHADADHFRCNVAPVRQKALGYDAVVAVNIANAAIKRRSGYQTSHRAHGIRATGLLVLRSIQSPDADCGVELRQMERIAVCDAAHLSRNGIGLSGNGDRKNYA